MNYRYHIILGGPRPILERLKAEIRAKPPVVDRPARASLDLVLMGNTPEFETVQRYIKQYRLSDFTRKEAVYDDAEIASAPLLNLAGCHWLSDTCEEYDEPDFSDEGRCHRCGRGATALRTPLRLSPTRVPARAHLVRIPPVLVVVSASFAMLVRKKKWSGVRLRQIVNRRTGEPTERHFVLEIASILPPMQKRSFKRSVIPKSCAVCKRLGYQFVAEAPVYSSDVLDVAQDWNLSTEWLAPHFVGCPAIIVKQHVAMGLKSLDKKVRWIPVELVSSTRRSR